MVPYINTYDATYCDTTHNCDTAYTLTAYSSPMSEIMKELKKGIDEMRKSLTVLSMNSTRKEHEAHNKILYKNLLVKKPVNNFNNILPQKII